MEELIKIYETELANDKKKCNNLRTQLHKLQKSISTRSSELEMLKRVRDKTLEVKQRDHYKTKIYRRK